MELPQAVPELAREDPSPGPRGRTSFRRQGLPSCHIVERRGGIYVTASKRSFVDVLTEVLCARNDESGNLCFACAPTPGLADSAQVTSFYESNALPLVATERVMKNLEARWREGDGVHWLSQVRSNLG